MNEVSLESLHTERPDPLWPGGGAQEFDYDEVERRVAGECGVLDEPGELIAETLARAFSWLAEGPDGEPAKDLRRVGARAVAAATALKIYERGHGLTQRSVARRLGVPNSTLNDLVHQFRAQLPRLSRRTKTARKPQQIRPELN